MRRLFLLSLLALLVAGTGVASADETIFGNLGKPDSVTRSSFTLTFLAPTGSCPGFAAGDQLLFTAATVSGTSKFWEDTSSGIPCRVANYKVTGTASAAGFTYTVRGHQQADYPAETESLGFGKVTIVRSDGARAEGDGGLWWSPLVFRDGDVLSWSPTCS